MTNAQKRGLWLRWVCANGLGEMVGLGSTFAIGISVIARLGGDETIKAILLAFFVAVFSGAVEATIVGLAQWLVIRKWFTGISAWAWWLATMVGALLAYVLGYLPSTIMSIGEQAATTPAPATEPEQWVVLLLAAALGLVGGAMLSFAQFLTMRRRVQKSGVWIPANMLAWMVGMPMIFQGIDITQRLNGLAWQVLFMAGVLLVTGAVVGAIHGAFLVKMAEKNMATRAPLA